MQVTIDIPEPVYRDVEQQAQPERKTTAEVLVERKRRSADAGSRTAHSVLLRVEKTTPR